MKADSKPFLPAAHRPRPKGFLRLDLDNAYARLGVSPLASTEEIADRISELRGKANKTAKAAVDPATKAAAEDEILRLDNISDEIGSPRQRERYDENFPQNILLTVQSSSSEQMWLRHRRAGLISEWLRQGLEPDAFLPAVDCLALWAPAGLSPHFLALLAASRSPEPIAARGELSPNEMPSQDSLGVADLDPYSKE
jgi:hypothetical protein